LSTPKLRETTDFNTNWQYRLHWPKWFPYPWFLPDIRLPRTSPFVLSVQSSVSAIAVARNALQQIPKLAEVSWKSALLSSAVHFINATCTTLDTYLNIGYPHYDPLTCHAVSSDAIASMSLEERFRHD